MGGRHAIEQQMRRIPHNALQPPRTATDAVCAAVDDLLARSLATARDCRINQRPDIT